MMNSPVIPPEDESVPTWVSRWGALIGVGLFLGLLVLPTPEGLHPSGQRMAAATVLMGIFWVTLALPMEVTSLLPLALFPLLGVQSAKDVSASYFTDSSFLYLGGFILALGIERWGLHRRLALHIVTRTGTGVRRIVLGFMLATFLLSMWISNTAAALLMLPIGLALLTSLDLLQPGFESLSRFQRRTAPLGTALMLGIGYSATLGGMATVVGTPTNIVYLEVLLKQFPDAPPMSAAQWIAIWTPASLALLIATWILLTARLTTPAEWSGLGRGDFQKQLEELGPMSGAERTMFVVFLTTALLWLTRTGIDFEGSWSIPGWNVLAEQWLSALGVAKGRSAWINDSTVAMTMALLMFAIPVRSAVDQPWKPLMDWHTARRLPWGILLLFGGGFAIADASRITGLAEWAGQGLAASVTDLPTWVIMLLIVLLITFLSEFTSNVATANALLPMVAGLAVALQIDPRLLMLPATLAASNGFMLPIGTPPNAIVFGTNRIRIGQMVGYGAVLDLVGVVLIVLAAYLLMIPQMGISPQGLPDWAQPAAVNIPGS